MTHYLVSLQEQPQHLPTVAGWIHRQWWSGTRTTPEAIADWLGGHLNDEGFPATFVLLSDGKPAGPVCLHETEAADRPAYTPYLGALLVKAEHRGRGFGVALLRAAEAHAERLGRAAIYLNAADPVTPFYEARGWRVVERGYGPKRLNILERKLKPGR